MKDFLGQEVSVGDHVVITSYGGYGLSKGVIEKMSPKTVVVRTSPGKYGTTRKGRDYFVKIQEVTSE